MADVVAVATDLDEGLQGRRDGDRFCLPAHGIFFGELPAGASAH